MASGLPSIFEDHLIGSVHWVLTKTLKFDPDVLEDNVLFFLGLKRKQRKGKAIEGIISILKRFTLISLVHISHGDVMEFLDDQTKMPYDRKFFI